MTQEVGNLVQNRKEVNVRLRKIKSVRAFEEYKKGRKKVRTQAGSRRARKEPCNVLGK